MSKPTKNPSLAKQLTHYLVKLWLGFTFLFGAVILMSIHQLHEKLLESQLDASFANVSATLIDPILLKEYGRIERHLQTLIEEKQLTYVALFFPEDSTGIIAGSLQESLPMRTHNIVLDEEHLATLSVQAADPIEPPIMLLFWSLFSIMAFTVLSFLGIKKRLVQQFIEPIGQLTQQALNNQQPTPSSNSSSEVQTLAGLLAQLLQERHDAIENVQTLAQQQNETLGKLCAENRLATIGQLTAEVAHELNTPLSNILVYSQWLQDNPHEQETALKTIESQARKAGQIVQRILQQTRLPASENREIDLILVCREFVQLMQPIAKRKGCQLIIDAPSHPVIVLANATALEQILLNLTNNSLYANALIIKLTIDLSEGIYLKLCDNGKGISEAIQHQLFHAFATDKPAGQGSGLGLFICRKLAQTMQADLQFVPQQQGCCFVVNLTIPHHQ